MPRMDPEDVRKSYGIPLSAREVALIDAMRATMDPVPGRAALLREVIAGWLEDETGYRDQVRRPSARRPNRQPRAGQQRKEERPAENFGDLEERYGDAAEDMRDALDS